MKTKNTKNNMSYLKESEKRKRGEDGSDHGAVIGKVPGTEVREEVQCPEQAADSSSTDKQWPKSNDIHYHCDSFSQVHQ